MSEESKPVKPKIESLELNRETVADLTETEAEKAAGGRAPVGESLVDNCNSGRPPCK